MNLPVPVVGQDPGPQYATDVDSCLTLVDQHDHSPGHGVLITPSGLNINADLTINDNNLTSARSLRLQPQGAPLNGASDIGALYESGVDLYYNDGLGNQIRITQAGGIAGTPGSIANLVPPASASYVSANQTFVFQSGANVPANIDGGSFIFRNITAGSNGITVQAPSALSSNYNIILPALPSQTSVLTITSIGGMGTQTYDQIGQNMSSVGANAIQVTTTRATGTTVGTGGVAISISSGDFTTSATTPTSIGIPITLTTSGRPVQLMLQPDGNALPSFIAVGASAGNVDGNLFYIYRNGVEVSRHILSIDANASTILRSRVPPGAISFVDTPSAGIQSYQVYASAGTDSGSFTQMSYCTIVAYEL